VISKAINAFFNIFRYHKRKIFLLASLYSFFLYLLFPFNDLGDLVASKVSEMTGGQVFVNFDTLNLSIIPQPGLALTNVNVETAFTPKLTAKSLSVAPNVTGLLTFKPGVSIYAEELLGGDVSLSTRGSGKTAAGKMKQKLSLELENLNLSEIAKLAQLPMRLTGNISGNMESNFDMDFSEQPTGTLQLQASKVVLPDSSINTPIGPLALPKLNLNDIVLESKADKGVFEISKFVVGKPGGDLYASVTGRMDMRITKSGAEVYPQMGQYDLIVRLQVGEAFKQKMGMYLGILQAYQNAANSYAFRMMGQNMYAPPNISKVQ
jgi:type II secretion system protein N